MDLGRAIAQLRKKQCLNQKSLARKCSISQTYLSQIENNRKDPNLSTLKEISRALEVPLPILFFLAMNDGDIPEGKREAFGQLLEALGGEELGVGGWIFGFLSGRLGAHKRFLFSAVGLATTCRGRNLFLLGVSTGEVSAGRSFN